MHFSNFLFVQLRNEYLNFFFKARLLYIRHIYFTEKRLLDIAHNY